MNKRPTSHDIEIKKKFGQHFLNDETVVNNMLAAVSLNEQTSVFEIGCGEGFLTKRILEKPLARLWVFEIDQEWAEFVKKTIQDKRLTIFHEDFLRIDYTRLQQHAPWTVLANLPYQVTFPILRAFQEMRTILSEGVIMVQEEVAQKILKTSGRGYGFVSLYFQHYFSWRALTKVSPSAFFPPPKVYSRLLYFKPIIDTEPIVQEDDFWVFIKTCFRQPRRTLKNNLMQTHYHWRKIDENILNMRAQQLTKQDFLKMWNILLA